MPENAVNINYVPFRRQREFHELETEVAGFFGGWGSGKTRAGIAECWRNTCYAPGIPGILASASYPMMRRTLWKQLVQMLPGAKRWPRGPDGAPTRVKKHLGPLVREWRSDDKVLTLDIGDPKSPLSRGGTDWHFGSCERPTTLEGSEFGWGLLDEPRLVTEHGWEVFSSRIRDPRAPVLRKSITGVPAMGWMDEQFNRGVPGRAYIRASSDDNPYLPPSYVPQLNLSGRRAQAFRHGFFVHMEGTVYDDYEPIAQGDDLGSVIDIEPNPSWPTYLFIDFGRRRPYSGMMQRVPFGGHPMIPPGGADVIMDEVVAVDMREPIHAEKTAAMCIRWGVPVLDVWCDPAGNTPNSQTGLPSLQVYQHALRHVLSGGMRYSTSPIERYKPNRVDAVSGRLLGSDGARRLLVRRALTEPERANYGEGVAGIHRALLGLTYPKNRPHDPRPSKDGVNDHPCDALEYLLVGLYGVVEPPDILGLNAAPATVGEESAGVGYGGESYDQW